MSPQPKPAGRRRLLRSAVAGLASLPLLAACYTHLGPGAGAKALPQYAIDRSLGDIVFTRPGWPAELRADLLLPRKPGPHPVVVTIHGGSWANRERADMEPLAARLARHGYAVFNISYRFAPTHVYPAQLDDVREALRWIDRNAARYALDVTRINTWGFSSGAHLAALVAGHDANDEDAGNPPVRAVVAGGIPADLRKYDDSPVVERFIGGARDALPAIYADASPVVHVSADDPPVFLYHGALDRLVTPDQARDYYAELRRHGVAAELFIHRWRGHASLFLFGGEAEDLAIDFLNRKNRPRTAVGAWNRAGLPAAASN